MPTIVHLLASTFVGGPERQLLGLARYLAPQYRSVFLTFAEKGRSRAFVREAHKSKLAAETLTADTPWLRKATTEITQRLQDLQAQVVLCHGYKADLLGRIAARRAGIPVMAVSRGWTGECLKVRIYEAVDRYSLRWMDKVICVSDAQAAKVRRAGIGEERIEVIANAVDPDRFVEADKRDRAKLTRYFRQPRTRIIGAAGRLSPEKGFDVLIAAAEVALKRDPGLGFILFGDGPCRKALQKQIQVSGLQGQFILGGFRTDLDRFLPCFDVLVLPSYTEGLPNVVLEACAASVPVVATAVGGTPEVIEDELSGFLVPPGEPEQLADRICQAIESEEFRLQMGQRGRERVLEQFSFAAQAERYIALFESFGSKPVGASSEPDSSKLVDTESPCHS